MLPLDIYLEVRKKSQGLTIFTSSVKQKLEKAETKGVDISELQKRIFIW